jgi:4-coumarate--CoA ligase
MYWWPIIAGAFYANTTLTPANSAYTVPELLHQLRLSKAKALITEKNSLKNAIEAADTVGIPHDRILIVEEAMEGFKCWKDILVTDETVRLTPNDPNSVALLCFSSGTTGTSGVYVADVRSPESGHDIASESRCGGDAIQ